MTRSVDEHKTLLWSDKNTLVGTVVDSFLCVLVLSVLLLVGAADAAITCVARVTGAVLVGFGAGSRFFGDVISSVANVTGVAAC